MSPISRREFLEFMGRTTLAAGLAPALLSCTHVSRSPTKPTLPFAPIAPSTKDEIVLADGFHYTRLISWQDKLNQNGLEFGTNNDYTAYFPLNASRPSEGLLWVNHESQDPLFISGWNKGQKRHRRDVVREMKSVGGSLLHIEEKDARWSLVPNSRYNRRLDAFTKIPLISARPIAGTKTATGTLANCAGGVTPWRTILTCEENYDDCFGETVYADGKVSWRPGSQYCEWGEFFKRPPEHYGWVVEVNPLTGSAKKLTALGRFSHESATVVVAGDGRCVVYSGDDHNDECLYKFIADKPGSLEKGELFVADTNNGRWLPLNYSTQPVLQQHFKDQTEVLIRAREAARLVGATLLDRPEDVEIDPKTRAVYVTLTNNKPKKNLHGSIMKIEETNGDHLSLTFKASTFMTGGPGSPFSCPDNMVFDQRGNLWMTNDISDKSLNKDEYVPFGNNSLFYIPLSGPAAGLAYRVATAPVTAEFTGPSFSADGRTLFLSVQHPGEGSTTRENPISRWPLGGNHLPKSSVVTISGPALDALVL